jgi:hypothetical protein
MKRQPVWPLIVALIAVYLIAAAIEPCDGHSCDAEVSDVR